MYSVVLMMALSGGSDSIESCFGCRGCRCNGCSCNGCYGCNGCWGRGGCRGCAGYCSGCAGCYGGVRYSSYYGGGYHAVAPPSTAYASAPALEATIVVNLPADARLTVDGTATKSTTSRREFVTPTLERGKEYVYTFRAEIVRDGQSVHEERQVSVRAGETTQVPFNFSTAGVASR